MRSLFDVLASQQKWLTPRSRAIAILVTAWPLACRLRVFKIQQAVCLLLALIIFVNTLPRQVVTTPFQRPSDVYNLAQQQVLQIRALTCHDLDFQTMLA